MLTFKNDCLTTGGTSFTKNTDASSMVFLLDVEDFVTGITGGTSSGALDDGGKMLKYLN